MSSKKISKLISHWMWDDSIGNNIAASRQFEEKAAQLHDIPLVTPLLNDALCSLGITKLYSHQYESWKEIQSGKNIIITTGTASGKTLCYNLPALNKILHNPNSRSLYIFPTKALAQDQKAKLDEFNATLPENKRIKADIYDGDTSPHKRSAIRKSAQILLTNPDMLHQAILPHHTNWAEFFQNLDFVVIDEAHIYRGVFGSHINNLVRRLKRILKFYEKNTQFVLTTATIGNPLQHVRKLIEEEFVLISQDGSPKTEKTFLLYNPPVTNHEFNIRRSPMSEGIRLAGNLLSENLQTLVFADSRKAVELMLVSLSQMYPEDKGKLFAYRSGYLAAKRREIERALRNGEAKLVTATNALELGVDIGGVNAIMMLGYPGTISATWQQAGRAGRKDQSSVIVLLASQKPIDQFIMNHPEFIFSNNPENALTNPNNLLILLQHLQCAVFELPFDLDEKFGNLSQEDLIDLLESLKDMQILYKTNSRYFWQSDQYPASKVSLRSSGNNTILLRSIQNNKLITIGEIDELSSYWMVHPEAIFLQEGNSYFVEKLDLNQSMAVLSAVETDYFTSPIRNTDLELIKKQRSVKISGCTKNLGEILVTSEISGFRRILWDTREILDTKELDLPKTELRTIAYWLEFSEDLVDSLRQEGIWTGDPNDYGKSWKKQRELTLERDGHRCQICGIGERGVSLHIHHKQPFKKFTNEHQANQLDNLITLCPKCHQKAEMSVKVNSGLSGLANVLQHISPLIAMCDNRDIGIYSHPQSSLTSKNPCIAIYDQTPAGIGLAEGLYENHGILLRNADLLIKGCKCVDGCPSCVGAPGDFGQGAKEETLAILNLLLPGIGDLNV